MTDEERKSYVWKLNKSLYGLKTSSKRWYDTFSEKMKKLGFQTNDSDPCLFVLHEDDKLILVLLYVDDILMTGNDDALLERAARKSFERLLG